MKLNFDWHVFYKLSINNLLAVLISSHIIFQTQNNCSIFPMGNHREPLSQSNLFPRSPLFNILSICCNKADRNHHDVKIVFVLDLPVVHFLATSITQKNSSPLAFRSTIKTNVFIRKHSQGYYLNLCC